MRTFAMTGIVTASWMPAIISGSDMRATPPSLRMSAGTRSSAMTDTAPAASAIFAWSGVTTSMITPPLSISARPVLTRRVAVSFTATTLPMRHRGPESSGRPPTLTFRSLLQAESFDPVRVDRLVERVDAVRQCLEQAEQCRIRAHEARAVRAVVEALVGVAGQLGQRCVGDGDGVGAAVAGQAHGANDQR